jgi:urocanate hydratase
MMTFAEEVLQGIPDELPPPAVYDAAENHAPARKDILSREEKHLAIRNALRYFPEKFHAELAPEFAAELAAYGRIYMYRFRPRHPLFARPIHSYPHRSLQAAAIMLMIQNNLNPEVAQHPHELITYGGNGAVFQNWAQYRLTMQYLAAMTDNQTLHIYSGHPLGLFPSSPNAPRVVVTNGMMVPNYSQPDDWERFNALGVTQYGQMTAGSYMYIGPQGIVHGTTITLLNAGRLIAKNQEDLRGKLFVSSGLGGMSGAQPKAGNIAGCISVVAEVNEKAALKRHRQGWVDEVITGNLDQLAARVARAKRDKEVVSIAFIGNVVNVWEKFLEAGLRVDIGSDQTSLHNPFAGGYYPAGVSFDEANRLMVEQPDEFKTLVRQSLCRQVAAINRHAAEGTYFFDYGNAFLLEAARAGADVQGAHGREFRYPSYVQDIMGPMCFDFGFGPFRWVCATCRTEDLELTDQLAAETLARLAAEAPPETRNQLSDNLHWIREARKNNLVVGSPARILYADGVGRVQIALAFNEAIRRQRLGPVVLGRDHHDVSGTDSPYRETSNIYDGSRFTADMAVQNAIGDSFRGATWVSLHNGGGVGWGEAINGGFGMLLDGSPETDERIKNMLHFDVNNGIARRAWARNPNARYAIQHEMQRTPALQVTLPHAVNDQLINRLF